MRFPYFPKPKPIMSTSKHVSINTHPWMDIISEADTFHNSFENNKGSDKRLIRSVDVLPWFHGNVLSRTLVGERQKSMFATKKRAPFSSWAGKRKRR